MKIITGLVVLLISTSFYSTAEQSTYLSLSTFKCHIETANGPNVAVFSWDPKLLIEEQSRLLANSVATVTNERLMVKRVIECITEDKKFKDKFVRHLDEQRTDLDD
ncbi:MULTISPECIES: TapY2 family type IVa secretion system protein [Shewanella]|uniref:TapY2 family type IVa secretion system protein n=1 Tax=Shewanella TaxID=22 RepID=UPI000C42A595|nr:MULTISPECIES: TapY2 family type IVa secretion system protein [Shewanella]NCQ44591.1 hypothetical protein [Shewanella frigidimarina]NCO72254.1 hypothetical protein [Shewanella vesiculosa]NCP35934.1 hypothetical protein [Shewanella vesiculosa]NCP68679.1 hypothetical protein [Shewanella vesiculosa]NCP73598.1 hypothetical protein [Shewanella vesiculosa]